MLTSSFTRATQEIANQWFDVLEDSTIQWRGKDLCLAVDSNDGTNIVLGTCDSSSANQQFEFKDDRLQWIGGGSNPPKVVDNRSGNAEISEYNCYDDGQFLVLTGTGSDGMLGSIVITYTIARSGVITVSNKYKAGLGQPGNVLYMPRFGMQMVLPEGFERLEWYGRGLLPTYSDRAVEPLGIFNTLVDDNYMEFPRPQDSDNRVDTRWMSVTNDDLGVGIMIQGHQALSISVSHYPRDTCLDFNYYDQLPDKVANEYYWQCTKEKELYLNIDMVQMGVGGDNSWVRCQYQCWPFVCNIIFCCGS